MSAGYCVIGWPIGHTMSPFLHNRLFSLSGKAEVYDAQAVPPESLGDFVSSRTGGGFNVTIPHKRAVIPFLDELDDSAKKYGAVNTVVCGNKKIGFNTDGYGFLKAIESNGISLSGKVLICGAGGAARTMIYQAADAGCEVHIAVRKGSSSAAELISDLQPVLPSKLYATTLDEVEGGYDIIINATPCGMYPDIYSCPLDEGTFVGCKAVFDAIYNPMDTVFIQRARKNGAKCAGGMDMLVWQAVRAHEIWYGAQFSQSDIKKLVEDANAEMARIFGGDPK